MNTRFLHKSVLLQESIDGLDMQPGDIYLDGTLGSGGHAEAALHAVHAVNAAGRVTVIGLDRDEDALKRAGERLAAKGTQSASGENATVILRQANYRDLDHVLDEINVPQVNKIMLDIGLSSDQFDTSRRGFSFKEREPLLMTMEKHPELSTLTAKEIVNEWDEENIADIIYGYGEERYSRKIAKEIVAARAIAPIRTTDELVEIIKKATPFWYHRGKIHPATRTFQALRITVNDELNALKDGMRKGWDRLAPGGRMAIISFHSLEDRLVKNFYKEKALAGEGTILTKKPITASDAELKENPRARSAKLRIIQKN
ncbi:16S rRNA (cytosine(1402)-N(4))-methyltransferase RsmH [bacterium]|nr:16S rRNA (cytosine(1402)-N(4))-methyltransferase RsmH [bacterium]